ncbi:MAG: leucine-rich repeat protein [Clostridia bacterium]|nr:leucine-rich repeat protein [Clostridia bacterium]
MKKLTSIMLSFIAVVAVFLIVGCDTQEQKTGYSNRVFDVSAQSDGSVTVTSKKEDVGYSLTVKGAGAVLDYMDKKSVPWNVIAKQVKSITIEQGVTQIGDNFFSASPLDSVFLPSSVSVIGSSSFAEQTKIYSYSQTKLTTDRKVYYFSQTAPSTQGEYFHIVDGEPIIWQTLSFLFIGNSFTYRNGTTSEPRVPYLFKQIAENLGQQVEVDFVVEGSYTLTKYANETDPLGAVVKQKLENNRYDYVVLQERSTTPLNSYDAFNRAVAALKTKIQATQNGAEIYLYHTWGSPASIVDKYSSVAEMTKALKTAYDNCAAANEVKVTYVGNAITTAYEQGYPIYDTDNRHQSDLGAYLSACCHVASMLKLNVKNCSFYFTFDQTTAKAMQDIAYQTVNNR